jgi:hypothetical protein
MTNFDVRNLYNVSRDDHLGWLTKTVDHERKTYMFVYFPKGTFLRKRDAVYVNADGYAALTLTAKNRCNAVAVIDVDAVLEARYGWVVIPPSNGVDINWAPKSITCVYEQAKMVPYSNGMMRCHNAAYSFACNTVTNGLNSVTIGCAGTDTGFMTFYNIGDIVNTNSGIRGPITEVLNSAAAIIGASGAATPASISALLATVVSFDGGLKRTDVTITCANVKYEMNYFNGVGLADPINLCSAATIMFVNTCVAGSAFKVGDVVTLSGALLTTGYSTRAVTSINNAYAFTINAAVIVEGYGLAGKIANVNTAYATGDLGI